MRILIIDFAQKISSCNYHIIILFTEIICYCIVLRTYCTEATVCCIRYFNYHKIGLLLFWLANLHITYTQPCGVSCELLVVYLYMQLSNHLRILT